MNLVTKMSGNKATEAQAQELIDIFDLKGSGSVSEHCYVLCLATHETYISHIDICLHR
jgi:hypothetical protein